MSTIHHLSVPDLSCGHCVAAVTTALAGVPTLSGTRVDLAAKRVAFTLGDERQLPAALRRLADAGYPAVPATTPAG